MSARRLRGSAPTRWTCPRESKRGRGRNRSHGCGRSRARWMTPGGGMTMALDRVDAGDRVEPRPVFGRRDPDARGYFGAYGGRFVPETLVEPVAALERAYFAARTDPAFVDELVQVLRQFVGRPTPLYEAQRLSEDAGCRVFLKREDLAHTGAHKINNAVGQALLARRMGKTQIGRAHV